MSRSLVASAHRHKLLGHIASAAAVVCLLSGCATTVSQLEDARVLGRNDVEVQLGLSAPVNLALVDEVRAGLPVLERRVSEASEGGEPLTESEVRNLLRTGVGAVVLAPGLLTELAGRLGIGDRFELGLRLTSTVARLSGKMALLRAEDDGMDLAATVGVSGSGRTPTRCSRRAPQSSASSSS
jgi:hypothetical protein